MSPFPSRYQNKGVLACSIIALYLLAPSLDASRGVFISTAFALINILSSRIVPRKHQHGRAALYTAVSVVTYFILFNDQPWDFLFGGGAYQESPLPLAVCSLIMTVNGWLLLPGWRERRIYVMITLGLQIPIGLVIGTDLLQGVLGRTAELLQYRHRYSGVWEAWQFEWMLTYYLPVFFLNRIRKAQEKT